MLMKDSENSNTPMQDYLQELHQCRICPRNCNVNRLAGETGYCGATAGFHIASICLHKGEEPAISGNLGICNIFFSHCNMACIFCQNWQISCRNSPETDHRYTLEDILQEIIPMLEQGAKAVGFVSASHFIPQVKLIISELRNRGYSPVFVYNSGGYDKQEQIAGLEGFIDVYLPDFKYSGNSLALQLSGARDYRETALSALKEMYRQKGSTLICDTDGTAESGLIIRHLILPGYTDNSIGVLQLIAEELSESVTLSLMAQYCPTRAVAEHPRLSRPLLREEYDLVVEEMERLGFYKGWVQDLESSSHYRPDFSNEHPFETRREGKDR